VATSASPSSTWYQARINTWIQAAYRTYQVGLNESWNFDGTLTRNCTSTRPNSTLTTPKARGPQQLCVNPLHERAPSRERTIAERERSIVYRVTVKVSVAVLPAPSHAVTVSTFDPI
jgi:hypothetical protein